MNTPLHISHTTTAIADQVTAAIISQQIRGEDGGAPLKRCERPSADDDDDADRFKRARPGEEPWVGAMDKYTEEEVSFVYWHVFFCLIHVSFVCIQVSFVYMRRLGWACWRSTRKRRALFVYWHVSFGVLARLFWCVGTSLLVCWHVSFGVLARLFVYVMQVSFVYLHVPFVFVYIQVSFVCSRRLGRARGTST